MTSGFSIRLDTAREGIGEKLKAFKAAPDIVVREFKDKTGKVITPASTTPADATLLEAVRPFIEARIAELPEEFDGMLVIANGTIDKAAGRVAATIQCYGKKNHL